MAAKTAGTWAPYEPMGIGNLDQVDASPRFPLGFRVKAKDTGATGYGYGEFVYLKGVASTARGSVALVKSDFSTALVQARDKGSLAVALAATVANTYGFYQVLGQAVVSCDAGVVADAPLYIDGTAGRVDDTAVAGDQVIGMRAVTADDTNTCVAHLGTRPSTADFDNA